MGRISEFVGVLRGRITRRLRRRRSVPVEFFDASTNRWLEIENVANAVGRDQLALATFNVWNADYFANQRYHAIAELLAPHMPDVMVFQEVTPEALDTFCTHPRIRGHFHRAAVVGGDRDNYGQLMLSRLPISHATYTRLPTRARRGFLQAELRIKEGPLLICSIHLDSGKASARLRARQLNQVFKAFRAADDVVLLGDFNMRDTENNRIVSPYRDVWPDLRPHDAGFTEDTSINLMRLDSTNKTRQVRFDRVLIKSTTWAPAAIELLGVQPISTTLPRVFPSDHFGVSCRLLRLPPTR